MEIEIKYNPQEIMEPDSLLQALIKYELNSIFDNENYPSLQPTDIMTAAIIKVIRKYLIKIILEKRIEIESMYQEALETAHKKYPQFSIEEIREKIGDLNIKLV